jgi:hypothetical protein
MSCLLLHVFVWSYCIDRTNCVVSCIRLFCDPTACRRLDREGIYCRPRIDALYTVRVRHVLIASLSV